MSNSIMHKPACNMVTVYTVTCIYSRFSVNLDTGRETQVIKI